MSIFFLPSNNKCLSTVNLCKLQTFVANYEFMGDFQVRKTGKNKETHSNNWNTNTKNDNSSSGF